MNDNAAPEAAAAEQSTGTWPERFAAALAARQVRRERRAELRRQQAAQRAYGLRQRHARKLSRRRGEP